MAIRATADRMKHHSRALTFLLFTLAVAPSALAESGAVNLNVEAAIGSPYSGRYGTVISRRLGAGQAYGGHFSLAGDWQLFAPLALEVLGTGGFQVVPSIVNEFYTDRDVYSVVPAFFVGAGPRLRLLDKSPGNNLWTSAHAGFAYFDGPQFGIDLGIGFQAGVMKQLSVGPFARGSLYFDTNPDPPGAHSFLLTVGLNAQFDVVPFGPPPPKDTDGDGVLDDFDAAPTIPEDKDGFEDADGAPENDNDNDTVLDQVDDCPLEKGPPENKGCPVPPPKDSDGDGIIDEKDGAPLEPEDKDAFQDEDGIPDPDNDKDGILDTVDQCPLEVGVEEEKGCPMKDQDKDGVADRADNCQTEPGPKDNQGCPADKKQLVIVTREALKILEAVYFDTGKATIQKRSFKLLDQVAQIMNEKTYIKQIRVEGHTDADGPNDKNMKLSQARAEAVRTYLTNKGVDGARLVAAGFGEEKPVSDNDTKDGKAANRRVEFNVIQSD